MTIDTVFLDEEERIVPLEEAVFIVTTVLDDQGQFISEEWKRVVHRAPTPAQYDAAFDALGGLRPRSDRAGRLLALGGLAVLAAATAVAVSGGPTEVAVIVAVLGLASGLAGLARSTR